MRTRIAVIQILLFLSLLLAGCAVFGGARPAQEMTRAQAVQLANAAAAKAGYDLRKFGEPTNTGSSGQANPEDPVWSFDYSSCGQHFRWGCTGFTVTVDKATGKTQALAWQQLMPNKSFKPNPLRGSA